MLRVGQVAGILLPRADTRAISKTLVIMTIGRLGETVVRVVATSTMSENTNKCKQRSRAVPQNTR